MAQWTYRCYDDGKSPNLWERWFADNVSVHGSHDAVFDMIEQMEVWTGPNTKAFDKIVEVKLGGPVAWRIFGFYGAARQQFIVTGIGYHKGKVYHPKDILKTVKKRRKEIESGDKKAISCRRPTSP